MNTTALARRDPGPAIVSDTELVRRVRLGEQAAYALVMRRYNRRMFRVARSVLTDDSEAEDVVQEAYVRAFTKLDQLDDPSGLGAWLARIAMNEALGRLRRGKRVVFFEDHVRQDNLDSGSRGATTSDNMTSSRPSPERLAASGELGRLLESAIDELPEEFRAVFMLRAVEGMNVAETAATLSIRPETVKTRFHRARKLLQKSLRDQVTDQLPAAFQFDGERCDRMILGVLARLERTHSRSSFTI